MTTLARLKNSLELGRIGDAVKKADVVPAKAYDILGKAGKVASDPNGAQRFLSFPGARELSENPRVVARGKTSRSPILFPGTPRLVAKPKDPRCRQRSESDTTLKDSICKAHWIGTQARVMISDRPLRRNIPSIGLEVHVQQRRIEDVLRVPG
jgi:hypothetical protein